MNKKQKKILQILEIMQESQISVEDIQEAAHNNFDLLCKIHNSLRRVPFEKGKDLNPIGIFPFKNDNTYIVFDGLGHIANQNTKMQYAQEHQMAKVNIPTVDFFEKLFAVKYQLNATLVALKKPEFRDAYLARSPKYIPQANWIVAFFDDQEHLSSDFYESKEEAKICYIKKFIKFI